LPPYTEDSEVDQLNNRGGNIGRVINRNVPAGKTPYGYKYHADYEDLGHGRRKLLAACWLVDKLDPGGEPERGSEAWIVTRIFQWAGHENRTLYWVAKELNKLGVKPRKEVYRLQEIMAQQTLNEKTKEEAHRVLDTIRDMNLENVSFSDKQNLIAKLGIKTYPSADKKVVRISSIVQPDSCPFIFSPQIISMTSPKL